MERLDVHLENHHTVYCHHGREHTAVSRQRPGTKLNSRMEVNQNTTDARHMTYDNFPRYVEWVKTSKAWKSNSVEVMVMVTVSIPYNPQDAAKGRKPRTGKNTTLGSHSEMYTFYIKYKRNIYLEYYLYIHTLYYLFYLFLSTQHFLKQMNFKITCVRIKT